jgi:hypothetical protein
VEKNQSCSILYTNLNFYFPFILGYVKLALPNDDTGVLSWSATERVPGTVAGSGRDPRSAYGLAFNHRLARRRHEDAGFWV